MTPEEMKLEPNYRFDERSEPNPLFEQAMAEFRALADPIIRAGKRAVLRPVPGRPNCYDVVAEDDAG